jgi:hypothetical protein
MTGIDATHFGARLFLAVAEIQFDQLNEFK